MSTQTPTTENTDDRAKGLPTMHYVIAVILVIAALFAGHLAGAQHASGLPPCVTEDSTDCYWDADVMGNGYGRSFVDIGGTAYYAE